MIRGTTPTLTITLPDGFDMTSVQAYELWLRAERSGYKLHFTDEQITKTEGAVSITLTQEQTLKFDNNENIAVQLRFINSAGRVGATYKATISIAEFIGEGEFNG
jgi:hypothetical protein